MKLLFKILFFVLAIFQTNSNEAKIIVFDRVVSEIKFTVDEESKIQSNLISENDFGRTCKSEGNLVDYRNWATGVAALPHSMVKSNSI